MRHGDHAVGTLTARCRRAIPRPDRPVHRRRMRFIQNQPAPNRSHNAASSAQRRHIAIHAEHRFRHHKLPPAASRMRTQPDLQRSSNPDADKSPSALQTTESHQSNSHDSIHPKKPHRPSSTPTSAIPHSPHTRSRNRAPPRSRQTPQTLCSSSSHTSRMPRQQSRSRSSDSRRLSHRIQNRRPQRVRSPPTPNNRSSTRFTPRNLGQRLRRWLRDSSSRSPSSSSR